MFLEPQAVTYNGTNFSLPRISSGVNGGLFRTADQAVALEMRHAQGRRNRHSAQLSLVKVAPDPFQTALNARYSMSIQTFIDVPPVGFTVAEQLAGLLAMASWISASSGANGAKLVGGEN